MITCPLTKTNCLICENLAEEYPLLSLIQSLEKAKGKLNNMGLFTNNFPEVNFKSMPLTDREKCSLSLLLKGKTIKEMAIYFNLSYNYFRSWLSQTLYSYCKILAFDNNWIFPNNKFNFSVFSELWQQHYHQKKSRFSPTKQQSDSVWVVLGYQGNHEKNGKTVPKFTVNFQCEIQSIDEDVIEKVVTTMELITQDDRWVIVTDKKIINYRLAHRKTWNYERELQQFSLLYFFLEEEKTLLLHRSNLAFC